MANEMIILFNSYSHYCRGAVFYETGCTVVLYTVQSILGITALLGTTHKMQYFSEYASKPPEILNIYHKHLSTNLVDASQI